MTSENIEFTRDKRPRASADFTESLICLICSDYFKPPVVQCIKGHSYCSSCVDKMSGKLCPVCRSNITDEIRNYTLENLLDKCTTSCNYETRGCKRRVSLYERGEHEKECEHRPLVSCYYKNIQNCDWKGEANALPAHLASLHTVQELSRGQLFRYLWNPPNQHIWRYRFRILKQIVTPDSAPFTFILEHFYCPESQLLAFLIRSPDSDIKRKYKISILNRQSEANRLSFESTTVNFEEFGHVKDFLKSDLKKVFVVPFAQIQDFCFFCTEDNTHYFSLHIQFF